MVYKKHKEPTTSPPQLFIKCKSTQTPPKYATTCSAAMYLRATRPVTLYPRERKKVPTGLHVSIPEGWVGFVKSRSGISYRSGIEVGAGIIDPDYRGEIHIVLYNHSPFGTQPFRWEEGERLAQFLVVPAPRIRWLHVDELPKTERGQNGFGSTQK